MRGIVQFIKNVQGDLLNVLLIRKILVASQAFNWDHGSERDVLLSAGLIKPEESRQRVTLYSVIAIMDDAGDWVEHLSEFFPTEVLARAWRDEHCRS